MMPLEQVVCRMGYSIGIGQAAWIIHYHQGHRNNNPTAHKVHVAMLISSISVSRGT